MRVACKSNEVPITTYRFVGKLPRDIHTGIAVLAPLLHQRELESWMINLCKKKAEKFVSATRENQRGI